MNAQSLQHPVIFVTNEERFEILEKIEKYQWAKSIVDKLYGRVDDKLKTHQLNMCVPSENKRAYTKALAPPNREAINGYIDKKTQVVVIRQDGEAWDKPFVAVFESTSSSLSSIQKVENLMDINKVVGPKVVSKVGKAVITHYVISQDEGNKVYKIAKLKIKFEGRYGIVRVKEVHKKKRLVFTLGKAKASVLEKKL